MSPSTRREGPSASNAVLIQAYFMAAIWGGMIALFLLAFWTMRGRFELGRYLLALAGQISAQATNVFGLVFVSESPWTSDFMSVGRAKRAARPCKCSWLNVQA